MDREKRIEELEGEVRELTALAARLEAEQTAAGEAKRGHAARKARKRAGRKLGEAKSQYSADVSRNVDKVLGGEPGEGIEWRIGGIWLSRAAVVILMTAVVLGARATLQSEILAPVHKVLIGYGVSLVGIAYGLAARKERDLFPETILGAGLAGVYFTTYAAFFMEGVAIFAARAPALPLLLGCLAFLAWVAHWRRSQTVAGVSLFLAYYTVVLSCMDERNVHNLSYALGTCAMLAVVALLFHVAHRWLVFSWVAMIATHLAYLYFFLVKPEGLAMTDREYFWVSNGYLTLCWVVFSLACIVDARKTGEYRRVVAPMSGVNSFVFFCLAWISIRQNYMEYEWMFRLGIAGMLGLFSILTALTGPRLNYLFQVFVAKTLIMFTLALQAYLSGEKLMVAIALQCLGLAFSYKRAALPIFKVLGLGLLAVTFVGCLFSIRSADVLTLGPYEVPAKWFCGVGAPFVFVFVAWFYERYIRRLKPQDRVVSGQWVMADTFLDLSSGTVALLHAAAAALILLTLTIADKADHPGLPYLLCGGGVVMAGLGFVLRTPQVEVASVLLVVAAHVCYYAFLLFGPIGSTGPSAFESQENYRVYTVLLALFTYVGGYLWERYLRRVKGGKPWEHDLIAAAPYLAATFMLTTLIARSFLPVRAAIGQAGLGVVLLLAGGLTGFVGMTISSVLAFALGAFKYYVALCAVEAPIQDHPRYIEYLLLPVVMFAGAHLWERYLRRVKGHPPWERDIIAAAPYLAATFMLAAFLGRALDGLDAVAAQNGLGVALLLGGCLTRFTGMKASGVIAFGVGTATFYRGLYTLEAPIQEHPHFAAYLLLLLATYAMGERLFGVRRDPPHAPTPTDAVLRGLFVGAGVFVGMLGLAAWCPDNALTLHWVGLGMGAVVVGAALRESRYRWGALVVFGIAIGHAFVVDLRGLHPNYQFLSFAGLALALLIVSRAYSRRRRRALETRDADPIRDSSADG